MHARLAILIILLDLIFTTFSVRKREEEHDRFDFETSWSGLKEKSTTLFATIYSSP